MKPSTLRWGLIFIAIGVMLLLNNTGNLDWDYWWNLAVWWPLLLIAIGIEKIFAKSKLNFISYLSPALLIAAMVFIAVDTGKSDYRNRGFASSYDWEETIDVAISRIKAEIKHGDNDIRIRPGAGQLASVHVDRLSRKPDIDYRVVDGVALLDIDNRGKSSPSLVINDRRFLNNWRISFPETIPLELICHGDESELNLNLQSIPVEKLKVENEESAIYLKIGSEVPAVDIEVNGDDSRLKLRIPDQAGIIVMGDNYSGYLERIGFEQTADGYQSENYDSCEVKITLLLGDELGSLSIVGY